MNHILLKKNPTPIVRCAYYNLVRDELIKNHVYVSGYTDVDGYIYTYIFRPNSDKHETTVGSFINLNQKFFSSSTRCCSLPETKYRKASLDQELHLELCETLNKYVEPPF